MRTLTIRLPEALVAEIEGESRSRRISKSDVVRERLRQPQPEAGEGGNANKLIGAILHRSWQAKVPALPRKFRSLKKQRLVESIRAGNLHR